MTPEQLIGKRLLENSPVDGWDPKDWRIERILDDDRSIPDLDRFKLRPEERGWVEAWNAFVQEIPSDWLPGFPIWSDAFELDPEIPEPSPRWKRDFLQKNSRFYLENRKAIDRWRRRRWGPLGQELREFPPSRRKFEWQARSWQPTCENRDLWKLVLQFRPSGIRVRPPTYLPALVAINQASIIGSRGRRITPSEAARLQGMDPDYLREGLVDDSVAYRQLGNAVNVGVVEYVTKALLEASSRGWFLDGG
jgi:DNA (cytosine-5)-methyltransferase 1